MSRSLGAAAVRALAALGVHTDGDLLRYYPRRYVAPGRPADLGGLVEGEHVTVVGEVARAHVRTTSTGKTLMEVLVTDGSGTLRIAFFARHRNALQHHQRVLTPGARAYFTGVVSRYHGDLQLVHPDFDTLEQDPAAASRPKPIYPASKAIPSWAIENAVRAVLDPLREDDLPDPLPDDVRAAHHYPGLVRALHQVHRPQTDDDWRVARSRLRFEEAFVLQAELARRRVRADARPGMARPYRPGGLLDAFDARLPFELTAGQREVGAQLAADLARPVPMQRLLQGEVGSGKTVVALRAMLQVVDAGGQAALLAPTEVLAAQHLRTLRGLLGDLAEEGLLGGAEQATRVVLLTGSQTAAARRAALLDAASGRAGIVIGTHALLSDQVQLADLGLVVVDEQHRFGVRQRDALRAKARLVPHTLVMTATPIPRTVAMTTFGDLETSVLRDIPAGRAGTRTHVVPTARPEWLRRAWQRVAEAAREGARAYVVCARIDPDEPPGTGDDDADLVLDTAEPGQDARPRPPLRAVLEVAEQLRAEPVLAGVGVGVLHGRMPPELKDRAFSDFASGATPVLVSTTVIEVGVDVPAATVMVVLDADRFGLSQLHQLRGRVGRGAARGLCLLVSDAPEGSDAQRRLATLEATSDGFALAEADLELRREGDVLGAAQSGASSSLRLLRISRDEQVIARARAAAVEVVRVDPQLAAHPALAAAIQERLAGDREEYLDRT